MRNLLVVIPNATDATSLYRGMGPLGRLKERMPNLSLLMTDKVNWATLGMVDAVFMQRGFTRDHLAIAEMVKANQKPLWVDYDDDLFQVPEWNPAHEQYGNENVKQQIARIIALSDVVTVSTEQLKQNLQPAEAPLNKNVIVIPNALNEKLFRRDGRPGGRNPLMLWRGSATHDKDLLTYTREMTELSQRYRAITWTFMGNPGWLTMEMMRGPNVMRTPALDPVEYMEVIQKVRPAAMVVPLYDCGFNRAKSNIAWLEGVYAGGLAICPDWEEWRRPGSLTYRDGPSFAAAVTSVIQGDVDIEAQNAIAWEYVQDCLTIGKVNSLREEIVLGLFRE